MILGEKMTNFKIDEKMGLNKRCLRRKKWGLTPRNLILILLSLIIIVLGFLLLRQILHKQKGAEISPSKINTEREQPPILEVKPGPEQLLGGYYTASFVDSFSGQAWLDPEKTNFYFDWTSTNLLFPPVLKTKEILTPALDNFIPKEVISDIRENPLSNPRESALPIRQEAERHILFFGAHRLSQKKEIVVWRMTLTNTDMTRTDAEGGWSKYDGEILGFEKDEEILQVKFLNKNKWLVLSRLNGVLKLNFLELSSQGRSASGGKKENLISTPFKTTENLICQQEAQIECDSEKCLLSCSNEWEFWEINLANKNLQKLEKLSAFLQQNKPEQITIFNFENSGFWKLGRSNSKWLIVRSQKIAKADIRENPLSNPRESASASEASSDKEYQIILEQLKADQTLELFAPTQKAEYPGRPSLLQFAHKIFLFWGSYFTQAYEINAKGEVTDLTPSFGWRISANKPYHLYKLPHFIYIKNEDRSIIRWGGGTNVRIDPQFWLTFSPDFMRIITKSEEDGGYLIAGVPSGGTKVYWFSDSGFDLSRPQTAASVKINFPVAKIAAARITRVDGNSENAKIKYWLSNDGGATWQETAPGEITLFNKTQTDTDLTRTNTENIRVNQRTNPRASALVENDLRWKIEITPNQFGTSYTTPYLGAIYLEYWYAR